MIYFIFQEISSLLLIFSYLLNLYYIFFLLLIIKLSIFPLHNWIIKLNKNNNWIIIFFLLTYQKFVPILITSIFIFNYIFILLVINSFFSILILTFIKSNKEMFSISSINNITWLIILSIYSKSIIFFFFFIYIIINYTIIMYTKIINNINMNTNIKLNIFFLIFILNLISFPPSLIFIFKVKIFFIMIFYSINLIFIIIIIICSIYIGIFYFIYFISLNLNLYWNKNYTKINTNIFFIYLPLIFYLIY